MLCKGKCLSACCNRWLLSRGNACLPHCNRWLLSRGNACLSLCIKSTVCRGKCLLFIPFVYLPVHVEGQDGGLLSGEDAHSVRLWVNYKHTRKLISAWNTISQTQSPESPAVTHLTCVNTRYITPPEVHPVYAPGIYTHARWELRQTALVFVVVFVLHISSTN